MSASQPARPITKAMILAAGQGSRLRPLTDTRPKPMLPVGGKPLLEHTLQQLVNFGIREAAINLHYCPDAVRDYFGDGSRYGLDLIYSYEPQLLGTAGSLKKLQSFFAEEPFLVMYGDNLTTCNLHHLTQHHDAHDGLATIALFWREDVSPHSAVEIHDDTRIVRFVEKPKPAEAPSHWISAGVFICKPEILRYIPEDRPADWGFDVFPSLLARGEKLYGYYMGEQEGLWWIDTPADYQRIFQLWQNGVPF